MAEVDSDRLRHLDHILVKQLATFHSDGDGLARRLHNLRIADPAATGTATRKPRPLSACGDPGSRSSKMPGSDWDSLCGDIMKLLKLTSVVTDENTRLRSLVARMEAEARTAAQQQPVASPTGRGYSELENDLETLRKDKERLEHENARLRQQVDDASQCRSEEQEQQEQEAEEHGRLALAMEAKALTMLQEKHHLQEAECTFVSAEVSRLVAEGLAKIEQELLERRSKEGQQEDVASCIHYILPATAVSTFVVAVAVSYYTRASKHSNPS